MSLTSKDWKAWTHNKTLHVTGIVDTGNENYAFLKKRDPEDFNPSIYSLDLFSVIGIVPVKQPQLVPYNEELKGAAPKEIDIYFEGKSIAKITDIKKM